MIYILNKKYEVVGNLNVDGDLRRATRYFDDVYTEDLTTGAETFQFSTFADTIESYYLTAGNFVVFRHGGEDKLFNIINTEETHEEDIIKTVYCEMAGIELINEIIRPMNYSSSSLKNFLQAILVETEWQLGTYDMGFGEVRDFDIKEYKSVYTLIQEYVIGEYGAEISYRVKMSRGRIIGKFIDVYKSRGTDNGARFAYGKNVSSVKKTVDTSELATALIGVGRNNLTFKSVDAPDKPLHQDFIENQAAYERWNQNGSHIMGIHKVDTESPHELLNLTRKELAKRCNPKIKYEVKADIIEEDLELGDTVRVVDHDFMPPLYLSARVNQIKRSKADPTKDELVLANFRQLKSYITDDMRDIIGNIVEDKFPIGGDDIQNGAIDEDKLYPGQIITGTHIYADSITAKHIKADQIEAGHIKADSIKTKHLTADSIEAKHIKADQIEADHIQASAIQTRHLGANSITSEHIQAGTIVSGSGIIAEGAIGSAQISDLDAGKISAGKIDTSKVEIAGANSHFLIRGNRLQVFDGLGNKAVERVSLGDVDNDGTKYGLRIRGADGETVLLDENGVTREGITDGSITNDKISGEANIDGAKLNINSVVRKINEDGSESIQGTKIEVEGTKLDAKLSQMNIKQDEQGEKISENSLKIQATEESLKTKVDSQSYEQDKETMTSKMDKNTSSIEQLKDQVALKVEKVDITNAINDIESGSKNLLRNSTFIENTEFWKAITPEDTTLERYMYANKFALRVFKNKGSVGKQTLGISYDKKDLYFLKGEWYTLNFRFKPYNEVSIHQVNYFHLVNDTKDFDISTFTEYERMVEDPDDLDGYYRVIVKFKPDENIVGVNLVVGATIDLESKENVTGIGVSEFMLNEGNLPMNWMAAPEDTTDLVQNLDLRLQSAEQTLTPDGITSVVQQTTLIKDMQGNITEMTDNISKVEQKADSITSTVSDLNGKYTQIKQTVDNIDLRGYVTFRNLATEGQTDIHGGNIETDTIALNCLNSNSPNPIIRLFQNGSEYCSIDATKRYETYGRGDAIRLKWNKYNYVYMGENNMRCFMGTSGNDYETVFNVTPTSISHGGKALSKEGHTHSGDTLAPNRVNCNYIGVGSRGVIMMHASLDGNGKNLGQSSSKFTQCVATNFYGKMNSTSDIRFKQNVKYLDDKNTNKALSSKDLSTSDLYDFVKNDLKLSTYNFTEEYLGEGIQDNHLNIGFIAQDIQNTKVGEHIVELYDDKGHLCYDVNNFINTLAGALQEEIKKRELLEQEVLKIKEQLNSIAK